ncbi:MAG: hypothetical protein LWW92_11420, partial [Rhodocyclales bacterium]|nr:hypothetical protein [Rhodocyclales bacterium]
MRHRRVHRNHQIEAADQGCGIEHVLTLVHPIHQGLRKLSTLPGTRPFLETDKGHPLHRQNRRPLVQGNAAMGILRQTGAASPDHPHLTAGQTGQTRLPEIDLGLRDLEIRETDAGQILER